jgi:hypothetical protein
MKRLTVVWLCAAACSSAPSPADRVPGAVLTGDPCLDPPTYERFAAGFTTSWCAPCHAASLPEDQRQGAPVGVDLQTLDELRIWSERIRVRAIDQADMPPGGGPSDEELQLLDRFLACGLPGSPTTPAGSCAAPVEVPAATVGPDDDWCAGRDAVRVTGDLVVQGADLSCVCEVEGALVVEGGATLDRLERAGAVSAVGASSLHLPRLRQVDGEVHLEDLDPALTLLSWPRLVSVAALRVGTAPGLDALQLDSLASVGDLELADAPLTELRSGLDSLTTVQGDLRLQRLDSASLLALGNLQTVSGDLELSDLPELLAIGGLRSLHTVGGDLTVEGVAVDATELSDWASAIEVGGTVSLPEESTTP